MVKRMGEEKEVKEVEKRKMGNQMITERKRREKKGR